MDSQVTQASLQPPTETQMNNELLFTEHIPNFPIELDRRLEMFIYLYGMHTFGGKDTHECFLATIKMTQRPLTRMKDPFEFDDSFFNLKDEQRNQILVT